MPELPFYKTENTRIPGVIAVGLPSPDDTRNFEQEFKNLLFIGKEVEHDLNAIKLALKFIDGHASAPQAIEELNSRSSQHRIGYKFRNGVFLRVDSQFCISGS